MHLDEPLNKWLNSTESFGLKKSLGVHPKPVPLFNSFVIIMTKTAQKAQQPTTQLSFTPGMQVCFPPKNGIGVVAEKRGRTANANKGKVPVVVRGEVKWFLPEELSLPGAEAKPEAQPEPQVEPRIQVPEDQRFLLLNSLSEDEFISDVEISANLEYPNTALVNLHLTALEAEGFVERKAGGISGGQDWKITESGIEEHSRIDPWEISDVFHVFAYGSDIEVIFEAFDDCYQFSFKGDISPDGFITERIDAPRIDIKASTPKQYALLAATQLRIKYTETFPNLKPQQEEEPIQVGDWVTTQTLRTPSEQRLDSGSDHQMYARVTAIKGKKAHISWFNSDTQTVDLYDLHKFSAEYVAKIDAIEQKKLSAIQNLDQMNPVERELAMDLARLDDDTRDRINSIGAEIDTLQNRRTDLNRRVVATEILIGKRLIEQRQVIKSDGTWYNWLATRGYAESEGQREAQYLMAIAESFGSLDTNTCSYFDFSSLKLLSSRSVDKDPSQLEVRQRFIQQASEGKPVRHRDVKAALDAVKPNPSLVKKPPSGGTNQGYSSTELKTNTNGNNSATTVDAEVKEQAQLLGLPTNGNQTLPTVQRPSPPAEVDDRPFAYEMAYTNPAIDVASEESGEMDYADFVETISREDAIRLIAAIGKKFGGYIFPEALQELKAGVS